MAFVDEITPEQQTLMPSYRKKRHEIAFSTNRIDPQKAIESVRSVYELLKLPTPEIQFFDSLDAAAVVAMLMSAAELKMAKQLYILLNVQDKNIQ